MPTIAERAFKQAGYVNGKKSVTPNFYFQVIDRVITCHFFKSGEWQSCCSHWMGGNTKKQILANIIDYEDAMLTEQL